MFIRLTSGLEYCHPHFIEHTLAVKSTVKNKEKEAGINEQFLLDVLQEQHRDHVCSISLSPDGLFAASAGHDGCVHFW